MEGEQIQMNVELSSALKDGVTILDTGYTFITSHALLFSICGVSIK